MVSEERRTALKLRSVDGLPPVPRRILWALMDADGNVPSSALMRFLKGQTLPKAVHVHVHRIRKWLLETGETHAIQNIHGEGYRFI